MNDMTLPDKAALLRGDFRLLIGGELVPAAGGTSYDDIDSAHRSGDQGERSRCGGGLRGPGRSCGRDRARIASKRSRRSEGLASVPGLGTPPVPDRTSTPFPFRTVS
jgi:hypothetical protein